MLCLGKSMYITLFHFKRQKDQSIHTGKSKVAQNEKQKTTYLGFLVQRI